MRPWSARGRATARSAGSGYLATGGSEASWRGSRHQLRHRRPRAGSSLEFDADLGQGLSRRNTDILEARRRAPPTLGVPSLPRGSLSGHSGSGTLAPRGDGPPNGGSTSKLRPHPVERWHDGGDGDRRGHEGPLAAAFHQGDWRAQGPGRGQGVQRSQGGQRSQEEAAGQDSPPVRVTAGAQPLPLPGRRCGGHPDRAKRSVLAARFVLADSRLVYDPETACDVSPVQGFAEDTGRSQEVRTPG